MHTVPSPVVVKRHPATLMFITQASTLFPDATTPELERAAGVASRYFRDGDLVLDRNGNYFSPIAAIAQALAGKRLAEATKELEEIQQHLQGATDVQVSDSACARWTPHIDAGVLFGLWLGVHLARIAGAAEGGAR